MSFKYDFVRQLLSILPSPVIHRSLTSISSLFAPLLSFFLFFFFFCYYLHNFKNPISEVSINFVGRCCAVFLSTFFFSPFAPSLLLPHFAFPRFFFGQIKSFPFAFPFREVSFRVQNRYRA